MPIKNGVALIGLVNKYNAPKTIVISQIKKNKVEVTLQEGGTFKALLPSKPVLVTVNDTPLEHYMFENGIFTAEISPATNSEVVLKSSF